MEIVTPLVVALAAYLLGSIPSGYIAGRAKGIDIRSMGSGNIGATNAFRILGKTVGTIVLVADGLKGWAAVALVPDFVCNLLNHTSGDQIPEYIRIIAGVGVILGHNYTCWLKFKGGKGIATSAGVLAALIPWSLVICLSVWIVVCLLTRYVSVASITAAICLPISAAIFYYPRAELIAIAFLLGALAIYKHKANIQRLMNGTENKIGRKPPPPTGASA